MFSACDPTTAVIECPVENTGGTGPAYGVGGGGAVLSSQMTQSYCYGISPALTASTDRDNDRVHDDCELEIASAVSPLLNVGDDDDRPARQSYWSLSRHPDRPDNVQIIYAIAYVMDGGQATFGWEWHQGDSEFIVLEVKNVTDSRWGIIEATLSAHFGSGGHDNTSTYYWDDLQYPGGAYPRIWASLDKHANYRSKSVCEAGGPFWSDSCEGSYVGTRMPVLSSRNLGNYYHVPPASRTTQTQLKDCVAWGGPLYMYYIYRTGLECFWLPETTRFSGWDPAKPHDVTPYWEIFLLFEF